MERPSISDPSFKAFLEELQKQNNRQNAATLLQLKAEREIAGEDNDKREEQLDNINNNLKSISTNVTGYNIEPLASNSENQLEVLKKALEELSLIRKLSEGSLEYDKASAQYRNTSGRELVSKVSGKEIKKGAYVDFESAADRLTGQGKRVREQNVLNLKPSMSVASKTRIPHSVTSSEGIGTPPSETDEDKSKYQGFFKELTSGIKFFLSDGLSEKPGYGLFQKPSHVVEKKEREQKVSSDREKIESPTNPESDNITTSQEVMADASKQDIEISKQLLETTKEQLKTLQQIKDALAPKTPAELPSKGPTIEPKEEEKEGGGLSSLASGALDLLGSKKVGSKSPGGSMGSKLAKFASGSGGKLLGAAAAVGAGAYTAYQGYTGAEEEKQKEIQVIDAKIKAGEITPEQGEQLKKESAAKTTENKGGAIGEGTGMAAGAIGGGIAGAKVGATIGTFVGGPVGTAIGAGIGGLAGGAIGAISGSSVGKNIGGAIGKGVAGVKSLFGMEDTKPDPSKIVKSGSFSVSGSEGNVEGIQTSDGKYYINSKEVSEKEYNEVKKKYNLTVDSKSSSTPVSAAPTSQKGLEIAKTSTENADMTRQVTASSSPVTPIISNNVQSSNTTKYVPTKPAPRPEYSGSALDRYTNRIAVF